MADLSGYPIIRIDQISLVASAVLSKAEPEVLDLMASLNAEEGPKPPLLFYLQRQLDAMRKELAERSAHERIESILKGTHLVDVPTSMTRMYSSSSTPSSSERPRDVSNQLNDISAVASFPSSSSVMVPPPTIPEFPTTSVPAVAYKRIPLPSELARQNSHITQHTAERTITSSSSNHIETPRNRTTTSSRDEEDESMSSEGGTSRMTSASSRGRSYDIDPLPNREDQPGTSEKKRPPRRSTSLRNNTVSAVVDTNNSPSKKPKIVRPFGSEFSVAATEKRIRFYPKKESKETVEELRAKDRLERRKAAMKR